jgi:hypothetical protein
MHSMLLLTTSKISMTLTIQHLTLRIDQYREVEQRASLFLQAIHLHCVLRPIKYVQTDPPIYRPGRHRIDPSLARRLSSSSHSLSCNIVNIIDVMIFTSELPIDCVLRMLYSENSSVIRIGALLILISVCPISPLELLSAPTLTLLLQTPSCKTLWQQPHLCSTSIGSQAVALWDRSHFICHGPLLFMIFNVLIIFNFFM